MELEQVPILGMKAEWGRPLALELESHAMGNPWLHLEKHSRLSSPLVPFSAIISN